MYRRYVNLLIFGSILFFASVVGVHAGHFADSYPVIGAPVGTPYPYPLDIARNPNDVPPNPLPNNATVKIIAAEIEAYLAPKLPGAAWAGDGSDVKFKYFAFGGGHSELDPAKVPGPFIRLREGRTVTVELVNPGSNSETHSIDLHAVLGKKGGAGILSAPPGGTVSFTFKAMNPGIYVYHCVGEGTPHGIAHHMNNGMFGLILVEPKNRLLTYNRVKRHAKEFYVFQQDIFRNPATLDFDEDKMLNTMVPDYSVFNGRVGALVDFPMVAKAGINAIIYEGASGVHVASIHTIGEIYDWVWDQGDLTSRPLRNIQTTLIPSAGAVAIGMKGSDLILTSPDLKDLNIHVDHASNYFRKGALGLMLVVP